tara:strand:+ start:99 stop:302 length:204 start_codon:yes stop_codon:yes gene_type:complete
MPDETVIFNNIGRLQAITNMFRQVIYVWSGVLWDSVIAIFLSHQSLRSLMKKLYDHFDRLAYRIAKM